MVTYEVTRITGGAYVGGTDWSAQFDDDTAAGYLQTDLVSSRGEVVLADASCGRRARIAISTPVPLTVPFYIENAGGGASGVQLQADGVIIGEYTTGTSSAFSVPAGTSIVALMWEKGSMEFAATFVTAILGRTALAAQAPVSGVGGNRRNSFSETTASTFF